MSLVRLASAACLCVCVAGCAAPEIVRPAPTVVEVDSAPETTPVEGDARGFPALRDRTGKPLADGSVHANSKLITLSDGRKVFAGSSADNAK